MKTLRTIPFANVHMALHQFGVDGADMLSAVDLVMAVTGKNCNHANELLRKLKPARFRRDNFSVVSRARYVTLEHAVELVMVMPGRLARQARRQFADIIVRYLDGDRSMCCEIEANQDMGMIKSCSALASRVAARAEAPTKAGDKNKVCSVTVVGDGDRVSLLFSPKPAWGHSRFARLVTDRMGSDLDPVPELAYGANQGRFGVHVPIALPRADLQMAIHCICSMYDASGPAACQTPVRSEHLVCTRCI